MSLTIAEGGSILQALPGFLFAGVLFLAGAAALLALDGLPPRVRNPVAALCLAGAGALVAGMVVGSPILAALAAGAAGLALLVFLRAVLARGDTLPAVEPETTTALAEAERALDEAQAANRGLEDTVLQRTRDLAETTRRFETALGGSDVTMFQQDADLRYTWVYNPIPGLGDIVGRTDEEVLPPATLVEVEALKRRVMETGESAEGEISLSSPEGDRWFKLRVEPLEGEPRTGITSIAVDVTAAKQSEAHLRAILRELTHRSRNLLAVIQGIARRTAASAETVDAFVDRFAARLQALAAAHDLLVDSSWKGAPMRELVDAQLAHIGGPGDRQVSVDGAPIVLKPDAAQHLSLALHELAVNAVQHGALSDGGGRVNVSWRLPGDQEGLVDVELVWREDGGPEVSEPASFGFGQVVLDRLVPRGLDGEATLEFKPSGVVWTLRFPTTNILTDGRS